MDLLEAALAVAAGGGDLGLLTATRLLRGEEDAGRWELLLAGRTTRRRATAQAIGSLAAGWLVLWTLSAALTVAAGSRSTVGFSTSGSLLYATAATASAAMFLAIGALASQLAATRRQANGLAAGAFAIAYVIRLIADSVSGAGWLRWASPLGWIEEIQPLADAQPLALAPIALLVVGASGLAILLAGRRDAGAAMLARRAPVRSRTRLLDSSALLVVRLERGVALAWIAGLAVMGAIFGITARSAAQGDVAVEEIERAVGRLGAQPASATAAWIGYEFLYLGALLAFAAAGQVAAMRSEEADGHLDHLLARPLDRRAWLAGRLGFAAAFVVAAALATALAGWAGIAGGPSGLGLGPMLQAGLNLVPPALLVLGLGILLLGAAPRLAMPLLYALVLWSFLIEIVGTSITSSRWLLDTALFTHVGPVPAASLDWPAMGVLTGLGLIAALAGLARSRVATSPPHEGGMPMTTEPVTEPTASRPARVDELEVKRTVTEALDRWPSAGVAVGIVRDGSPAWFFGHGVADVESKAPIARETVFRVGSLTKTFTAVAVMQLAERGLVDLDAPASSYLRGFRLRPARPAFQPTVRNLLTHTGGVGYWRRLSDVLQPGVGSGDLAGARSGRPGAERVLPSRPAGGDRARNQVGLQQPRLRRAGPDRRRRHRRAPRPLSARAAVRAARDGADRPPTVTTSARTAGEGLRPALARAQSRQRPRDPHSRRQWRLLVDGGHRALRRGASAHHER